MFYYFIFLCFSLGFVFVLLGFCFVRFLFCVLFAFVFVLLVIVFLFCFLFCNMVNNMVLYKYHGSYILQCYRIPHDTTTVQPQFFFIIVPEFYHCILETKFTALVKITRPLLCSVLHILFVMY